MSWGKGRISFSILCPSALDSASGVDMFMALDDGSHDFHESAWTEMIVSKISLTWVMTISRGVPLGQYVQRDRTNSL